MIKKTLFDQQQLSAIFSYVQFIGYGKNMQLKKNISKKNNTIFI